MYFLNALHIYGNRAGLNNSNYLANPYQLELSKFQRIAADNSRIS